MDFLTWKQAVLADVERIGYNKTYLKYDLSSSTLHTLIHGGDYAGLNSWARAGANKKPEDFQDPPIKTRFGRGTRSPKAKTSAPRKEA